MTEPNNAAIWTPVPNFAGLVTQFQNLITDIHTLAMEQGEIITGYSAEKVETRAKLVGATMKVVHGVRALAIFTDNQVLGETVNYTYSELRNSRDNVLADIAGIVYDTANPFEGDIDGYLVTAEDITLVNTLRTEFMEQIGRPRAMKVTSKNATEEMAQKFATTDALLKDRIDKTILIFKPGNPVFVNKYFDARMIVNSGVRHTGMKAGKIYGTIKDASTQIPLENVLMRIISTVRQVKSDAEGNYKFIFRGKSYPKIEATKDGYQTMTQGPMAVGPDMNIRLDFNLEPE